MVSGYYRNAYEIVGNEDITYTYNDGSKLNKKQDYVQDDKQRIYSTGLSARYDSENLIWVVQAGLKFTKAPGTHTRENVLYDGRDASTSETDATSQSLIPYVSSQFVKYGLPHKAYAYGGISFSYNHNKASNNYQLTGVKNQQLYNATREDAYVPSLWLGYGLPVYKQNYLIFTAQLNSEIYRTNYYGTADTFQKLLNSYYV